MGSKLKESEVDKPKEIIKSSIEEQKTLLSGFKGNKRINKKKYEEAQEPKHFAISLAGEPLIYPFIGNLIEELRRLRKTSFLVTNGLLSGRIKSIAKNGQLPTQLYISFNAPTKQIYNKIVRPSMRNAWEKFNETLKFLPKIETRKVLRMTLVKDLNMVEHKNYARLIKKASPDFVEIKGFMSVGFSRQRLGYERMPYHAEIREFAERIASLTELKVLDEKIESRVVVLGKDKDGLKIKST